MTATCPGEALDRWLLHSGNEDSGTEDSGNKAERAAVATALGRYIGRLHQLGFRCGNLDLRNLIAHRDPEGRWQIFLIDSPRYRLHGRDCHPDARSEADWQRLLPQLAAFDLAEIARRAARS